MGQTGRLLSILLGFYALFAAPAAAQVIAVTNGSPQGWAFTASAPGVNLPPAAAYLAPGFETPPLGTGSAHLAIGQNGNDAAQVRTNNFVGTRVDALTALSYSTFTEVDGSGGQSPYLIFHIDLDGNLATSDQDLWFFEPVYQSAAFFPSNPQGPLVVDTWQTWNALAGGWYSTSGLAASGPGANVKSISQLLVAAPNATLRASGSGGVRIVTGFGAGAWDNFVGAADAFRLATATTDVTYNFEPDAPVTVTVTPASLEQWTLTTTDDNPMTASSASSTIVPGPATPPLGVGSLRLAVGTDGNDSAEARSTRWDGLFLRDLASLTYATYHESGGSGGQAPYLMLRVDYDNNGTQDDLLFFEPVYQTGVFCPSNVQPAMTTGAWQTWNASNGCWWSLNGTGGATPGVGVKPLSAILGVQGDARLVTGAAGGSFRIVAGFGAGAWDNFIGYVDAVNVSLVPVPHTIYDFEPTPSIIIGDLSQAEGNAANSFNFTLTLSHAVSQTVTVQFTTADGTATSSDLDYVPITAAQTVTFLPNTTTATATVTVNGDLKFEPNETFLVNLATPVNATIADAQATGTITNDDPVPTVAIGDIELPEGNAGVTNFVFNVLLSNPTANTVTVDFTTVDGTAVAGDDYTAVAGTLTFNPGVTLQTINVPVMGDITTEAYDFFAVNLSNLVNAAPSDLQGLGSIANDDAQPTISINDVTLAEGNAGTTNFVFNVTLTNPSFLPITVQYATANNTAVAPGDYAATSGTLTFNPGVTLQSFSVPVVGDAVYEGNETFFVDLSTPSNATISDAQGLGTITNDEAVPSITIGDIAQAEGNAGTSTFTFTLTLSGASEQPVTVNYATVFGTATSPEDYAAASGTATFASLATTTTIAIQVAGDTTFEPDETFYIDLTVPTVATIADNQGLGTIQNDEGVPSASINDVTLAEGNAGTTSFVFTVTLTGPSGTPVTIDYGTAPGTATAGTDYTATAGTLTFAPGVLSQTITVPVLGEIVFEANETFFVNLTNPVGTAVGDNQGLGTITNDDPQPSISIGDVTQAEGNAGTTFTFTVMLSGPSGSAITVDYATANGTATAGTDYNAATGTVTFAAGVLSQTIAITVLGDTGFEPNETFFVNLTNAVGATIADNQALGTITNDDGAIADLALTKTGPATVTAGAPINYTITVSNNGPQPATNVVVTDIIPAGTAFVSATPSQGTCAGTTTVTCAIGTLANGGSATIALIVTAPPTLSGPITNTATASATEADTTPASGSTTAFAFGPNDIPTLSEWALLALLGALAAAAALKLR